MLGVLLDESRRDDIGWLVATYDGLVEQAAGESRDADLAQVQRWLCRVTGLPSLSAAVAAARHLTRHEITFIAPVALPVPGARREESVGWQRDAERQERRRTRTGQPKPDGTEVAAAPRLTDEIAARLETLLGRLDGLPQRERTAAEKAEAEHLRQQICELTGLSRAETARKALRTFLKRRDGKRRFVPTKPYAEGSPRTPPPIRVVLGGSPGSGSRA